MRSFVRVWLIAFLTLTNLLLLFVGTAPADLHTTAIADLDGAVFFINNPGSVPVMNAVASAESFAILPLSPEPASMVLMTLGGILLVLRRKANAKQHDGWVR